MPDPCFDFLLPTVHAVCIPALCLCRVSRSVQWNAVVHQAVKASAPAGRSWVLEVRDCRQPHSALLNAGSRDHALSHVGLLTALSLAQHGCAAGGVCKAFSRTAVRCTSRRRRPCGMPHSRGRGLLRARSAILCSQEHHQLPRYLQQMPQSPKACPSAGCQLRARLWSRIACHPVVYVKVQLLGCAILTGMASSSAALREDAGTHPLLAQPPSATTALHNVPSGSCQVPLSPDHDTGCRGFRFRVRGTRLGHSVPAQHGSHQVSAHQEGPWGTGMAAFADANGLQVHVEVRWRLSIGGQEWGRTEKTLYANIKPYLRQSYPCFAWRPWVPQPILLWQAVRLCSAHHLTTYPFLQVRCHQQHGLVQQE